MNKPKNIVMFSLVFLLLQTLTLALIYLSTSTLRFFEFGMLIGFNFGFYIVLLIWGLKEMGLIKYNGK